MAFDKNLGLPYPIDLDIHNKQNFITVYSKQYDKDSRYIVATLYDDGNLYTIPTGATASFGGTKPNTHIIVNTATIEDNKIYYRLDEQATVVNGTYEVEFTIYYNGTTLGSPTFKLFVEKAAVPSDAVVSVDEVNILNNLITDASLAISNANTATFNTNTAIDNANTATTNANTAKDNAITATTNANTAADLANTKAGLADTAATNANSKATLAQTATTNANTATTNANDAATNANAKATLADNASTNANNIATLLNTETLRIFKPSVATYADLATTYPTPENGWTVTVTGESVSYRYNGTTSTWINLGYIAAIDKATDTTLGTVKGGGNVTIETDGTLNVPEVGDLSTLNTTSKTDLVSAINEIDANIGDKTTLTTTDKSSLVNAIIEVNSKLGSISTYEQFYQNSKTGKKIVIVGDSTSDINTAPALDARLQVYISTGGLLDGATIINRGDSGQTIQGFLTGGYSSNSTTTIANTIADQGDLYIVSFGINDIRAGASSPGRSVTQITADLKTFIDRLLNETNGCILMRTPNPFLTTDGGYGWVSPNSNAQLYSDQLYQIYESFRGYNKRLDVIDIPTKVFGKTCLAIHPLMLNQLHPNTNGYRAIADEIANHISQAKGDFNFTPNEVIFKGVIESYDSTTITFVTRSNRVIKIGDVVYVGNSEGFVIASEPVNLSINNTTSTIYKWKVLSNGMDSSKYGVIHVIRKISETSPVKTTDTVTDWFQGVMQVNAGNFSPIIKSVIDLQSYGITGVQDFQIEYDYYISDTHIQNIYNKVYLNNVADINTITGGTNTSTGSQVVVYNQISHYWKSSSVDFTGQRYLHLLFQLNTNDVNNITYKIGNIKMTVNGIPISISNLTWVPHSSGTLVTTKISEPKLLVTKEYADNLVPSVLITNNKNWMENKVTKTTTNPTYIRAVIPISLSNSVDFLVNFNAFTRSTIVSSVYAQIFLNTDSSVITGGINVKGANITMSIGSSLACQTVLTLNTTGYTYLHLLLAANNSTTGDLAVQFGGINLKAGTSDTNLMSGVTWSLYSPESGAVLTQNVANPDSVLTYAQFIQELITRGLIT